jgi:hypothetical protein
MKTSDRIEVWAGVPVRVGPTGPRRITACVRVACVRLRRGDGYADSTAWGGVTDIGCGSIRWPMAQMNPRSSRAITETSHIAASRPTRSRRRPEKGV